MADNIFFSIVIPTYNRAELLRNTLRGFQEQVFRDFEIIVVDDGGKDHTQSVVENFNDSRFSYHWKTNAERGAARNYGARLAKGQWINFFDSDDLVYPNHLQTAFDFITKNPQVKVFHTSYDWVDIDTKKVFKQSIHTGILNEKLRIANCLSCNNVFIEKNTCHAYPFSERRELSGSEDWLLWLKLGADFPITGLPAITSSIVQHGSRSMITASGKSTEVRGKAMVDEIVESKYFNNKFNKEVHKVSSEMYSLSALHYALEKNKKEAWRTIKTAVKERPQILFSRRFVAVIRRIII